MGFQEYVALGIVIACALKVWGYIYANLSGKGSCSGGCKCPSSENEPMQVQSKNNSSV